MQADVLILCSIHSAGRSRFNETAIIGHSIIEPEAAGEVVTLEAVSGQDTTGNVAAQTALTDDVDRLTLVQLTQPLPQLVHRMLKKLSRVAPLWMRLLSTPPVPPKMPKNPVTLKCTKPRKGTNGGLG